MNILVAPIKEEIASNAQEQIVEVVQVTNDESISRRVKHLTVYFSRSLEHGRHRVQW